MDSTTLDRLTGWIGAHPLAAGLLVASIALADALPLVGMVVPSMAILLAVGTLIGLGILDPLWILACAAVGAFAGDLLGYLVGHRYGDRLRAVWPFSRYPQWLLRGEALFQRRGAWGVVIGRQIGAMRPFVPAIAGMLGMRPLPFTLAALIGALLWAPLYLAPGWLLGASWERIAAVAGRLGLLVLGCIALVAATISIIRRSYAFCAPRIGGRLERWVDWARRHPRGGQLLRGVLDPNAPESASLILLTLALLAMGLGGLVLLAIAGHERAAPAWDTYLAQSMTAFRHPLADRLALHLQALGSPLHVLASLLPGLLWLRWRGRQLAFRHWAGLLLASGSIAALLCALAPRLWPPSPMPGLHSAAFSAAAPGVLLAAAGWSFFAALMADEMPRKRRAWPYVLAGLVMLGVAMPRLYLGMAWSSTLAASLLLGAAIGALFGIAYRRRQRARLWHWPLVRIQLGGASAIAGLWLLFTPVPDAGLLPTAPARQLDEDGWLEGTVELPRQRDDFGSERRWPLNLQVLGDPATLADTLLASGWQRPVQGGWIDLLGLFDFRDGSRTPPYLPLIHDGRAEALLLRHPATDGSEWQLRLWPTPWRDAHGRVLHVGHLGRFVEARPFSLWRQWSLAGDEAAGLERVRGPLAGWTPPEASAAAQGDAPLRLSLPASASTVESMRTP